MAKSMIVYGPPASGKGSNANAIAALFELQNIVEEIAMPDDELRPVMSNPTLYLTASKTIAARFALEQNLKIYHINDVLRILRSLDALA